MYQPNPLLSREYEEEIFNLVHYKNYYVYGPMIKDEIQPVIYVPKDITLNTIDDHITGIFNILKDGIETDYVHNLKITVRWDDVGAWCNLSIIDYWISLFMWYMLLKTNNPIRPKHIFIGSKAKIMTGTGDKLFPWELQRKDISKWINKYILTLPNKIRIGNYNLNIIIADALHRFSYFEHFAFYLANSINNEDDIELMRRCPEYDALFHCSLSDVPIESVKDEGMKIAYRAIDIIKNSEAYLGYEHGLTNSFRANEAINPRQFKEAQLNIGTKPNGSGGIYGHIIDKSFTTGGVNDPLSYFIESSAARTAQIASKINVGEIMFAA